jgi:hypothetical protein
MSRRRPGTRYAHRAGAALLSLAAGVAPSLALALPATAAPAAAAVAAPPGCTAQQGANQALVIVVTRLEPRTIEPNGPIRVDATLRNCGSTTLSGVRFRIRTGDVLSTRAELAGADTATAPQYLHAIGDWLDRPAPIPSGGIDKLTYETTGNVLGLFRIGVYPVQLQVQADRGQGLDQVGALQTYLPFFPDGVERPTEVTWLLPFADRPHRLYNDSDHTLYDEALDYSMVGQGRLSRMMYVAENASAARVPYALAVDPDLADTAFQMSQGYKVLAGGKSVDGVGKQDATGWLSRLSAVAAGRDVIALPYADADLVALSGNGLTKLFPNAQDGARLLSSHLDGHPVREDIAWPAGGVLNDDALDQLVSGTVRTVVLDASSLANPRPGDRTQSAASPLPSASRDATALVADQQLNRIVTGGLAVPGGARLMEQRYLAELAMITAEAPAIQRRVLITPPHNWNVVPTQALRMMQDTVTVPWLAAGELAELAATPPAQQVDRGELVYPANAPRLTGTQVGAIRRCQDALDQLRSSLNNQAESDLLAPYPLALIRAASAAWRGTVANEQAGAKQLRPVFIRLGGLIDKQVRIIPPNPAKYTLAAQSTALPLTLVNDLPVRISVIVRVTPQGTAGFRAEDVPVDLLPNSRRAQIKVPAEVTQSGRFTVSAQLVTLDGKTLGGKPVTLEVQSTAYGAVALGITVGAFGLLLLLLIRRVIQQIRSGPAQPVPAGSPAERGT